MEATLTNGTVHGAICKLFKVRWMPDMNIHERAVMIANRRKRLPFSFFFLLSCETGVRGGHSEKELIENFRMLRATFNYLCQKLSVIITQTKYLPGATHNPENEHRNGVLLTGNGGRLQDNSGMTVQIEVALPKVRYNKYQI